MYSGRSEKSLKTWGTGEVTADDAGKGTGEDEAIGQGDRRGTVRILGCPAHDGADQAALEMLENLLDPARWSLELVAPDTLTAELLELVAEKKPALVCIAATPPGGLAHTRYLCKRLRARFPELADSRLPLGSASEHDFKSRTARRSRGRLDHHHTSRNAPATRESLARSRPKPKCVRCSSDAGAGRPRALRTSAESQAMRAS